MNTPETINIEKYAEALNDLIGVDSAYFQGDKNVDAIVEVIVAAKKLENRVKELEAEKDALIKNYAQCMKDYAKEIFDDIEKEVEIQDSLLREEYLLYLPAKIIELRKKYVEVINE